MWVLLSNELEFEATNVFRSTIGIEAAEKEIGPLSPSHPGLPREEVLSFAQQPPQTLVQHHCWQRAAHEGAIAHLWRSRMLGDGWPENWAKLMVLRRKSGGKVGYLFDHPNLGM